MSSEMRCVYGTVSTLTLAVEQPSLFGGKVGGI